MSAPRADATSTGAMPRGEMTDASLGSTDGMRVTAMPGTDMAATGATTSGSIASEMPRGAMNDPARALGTGTTTSEMPAGTIVASAGMSASGASGATAGANLATGPLTNERGRAAASGGPVAIGQAAAIELPGVWRLALVPVTGGGR